MSVQGNVDGLEDIMSDRKFFYGDTVEFISPLKYPAHVNHKGVVAGTEIHKNPRHLIIYKVQCECGNLLRPQAAQLSLYSEESIDISWARLCNFIEEAGKEIKSNKSLFSIKDKLFSRLNEREQDILTMRYGLNGENNKTLQQIADMQGVTRQRIHLIQSRAIGKLVTAS